MIRRHGAHDPWWGLEGTGARRTRRRVLFESLVAVTMAVAACGLVAAAWMRDLIPLVQRLGI